MTTKFDCQVVNGLSKAVCGRVDLLEKLLGYKVRENLKYADIQKIVKSGFAKEFFDIGDEIMTKYTATDGTKYDFPWLVVDFRDVEWEDGTKHPGMVLQAKYATAEKIPFDAAENAIVDSETEQTAQEGWYYFGHNGNKMDRGYVLLDLNVGDMIPFNDYTSVHKCEFDNPNIVAGGWSNYKESAIRQWLNSDAGANEWWEPTHSGDIAPDEASTLNGFMAGLSSDFTDIIKPTKVRIIYLASSGDDDINVYIDIIYDKMFLPSVEEMYGVGSYSPIEGPYFQYWKEATELRYPNNMANSGRIIPFIITDTNMPICWLRTMKAGYLGRIIIGNTGQISNGNPFFAIHTLPCCVIS